MNNNKLLPEQMTNEQRYQLHQQAQRLGTVKTYRNDLCPCGSNKKYKKCHLLLTYPISEPPVPPEDSLEGKTIE